MGPGVGVGAAEGANGDIDSLSGGGGEGEEGEEREGEEEEEAEEGVRREVAVKVGEWEGDATEVGSDWEGRTGAGLVRSDEEDAMEGWEIVEVVRRRDSQLEHFDDFFKGDDGKVEGVEICGWGWEDALGERNVFDPVGRSIFNRLERFDTRGMGTWDCVFGELWPILVVSFLSLDCDEMGIPLAENSLGALGGCNVRWEGGDVGADVVPNDGGDDVEAAFGIGKGALLLPGTLIFWGEATHKWSQQTSTRAPRTIVGWMRRGNRRIKPRINTQADRLS